MNFQKNPNENKIINDYTQKVWSLFAIEKHNKLRYNRGNIEEKGDFVRKFSEDGLNKPNKKLKDNDNKYKYIKWYPKMGTEELHFSFCLNCGKTLTVENNKIQFCNCTMYSLVSGLNFVIPISDEDKNVAYYIKSSSSSSGWDNDDILHLDEILNTIHTYHKELLKIDSHLLRQNRVDEMVYPLELKMKREIENQEIIFEIKSFISWINNRTDIIKKLYGDKLMHWQYIADKYINHMEKLLSLVYQENIDFVFESMKEKYTNHIENIIDYPEMYLLADETFKTGYLAFERKEYIPMGTYCEECGEKIYENETENRFCYECHNKVNNVIKNSKNKAFSYSKLQSFMILHSNKIDIITRFNKDFFYYSISAYMKFDSIIGNIKSSKYEYSIMVFNREPNTIYVGMKNLTNERLYILSHFAMLLSAERHVREWYLQILNNLSENDIDFALNTKNEMQNKDDRYWFYKNISADIQKL